MKKIKALQQTCVACPSQWDAETTDGEEVYIRYRWGRLSVQLGGPAGEFLYDEQVGDSFDGVMTEAQMINHLELAEVLDFSEVLE
jgi:hypothetical protein